MFRILLFVLCIPSYPLLGAQESNAQSITGKSFSSGRALEREIEEGFHRLGFEVIEGRDWDEARLYEHPDLVLVVKNAPYKSIYGANTYIEFLLLQNRQQILIEVKRQNVSGSNDEKLPYVVENAKANIELDRRYILVMDGNGWRAGARDWVVDQANIIDGFDVMSPPQLYRWLETK